MAYNNRVTLIGNLADDAQVHHDSNGNPYVIFRMATTDSYKDEKTNQWVELEPVWHSVFVFGKDMSGKVADFPKGFRVKVEGSISNSTEEKTLAGEKYYFQRSSIRAYKVTHEPLSRNLNVTEKKSENTAESDEQTTTF